jgi:probable rRNA maturation factor
MRTLLLSNRQQTADLDLSLMRQIGRYLLCQVAGINDYELGVHVVGSQEISQVNLTYLGHEGPTDVITFDHREDFHELEPVCGEIFLCPDEACMNARRFRTTWPQELVRYLVHGLLHLQGFDDLTPKGRRRMKRRENQWLRLLAARFPLSQLDRSTRVDS